MSDIFLSYSREDEAFARRFAEGFRREGLSVWWDQALNAGEAYDQITEKALKEAKAVVVLWSRKSVDSRWVRSEATLANRSGTLVPVMIEPCERPVMFELTHTPDLSNWKGEASSPAWQAFLFSVRQFVEGGAAGAKQSPEPSSREKAVEGPSSRTRVLLIALPALALLIAGGSWWAFGRKADAPPDLAEVPAPSSAASIAVLPFANLTGDQDKEYFSDGMAEELINKLSKVPGLKVSSRTSSFALKGKGGDIRQVARDLGVSTVLEGSVRSAGETIRITAQLIDAESGYNLWSESFERKYTDLFKLQDELAQEIVSAFRETMRADLPKYLSQPPRTENLEAYAYLQRGMLARSRGTAEGHQEALRLAEQAIARDPEFIDAYWLRAASNLNIRDLLGAASRLSQIESDARLMLEKSPDDSATARAMLAIVAANRGRFVESEGAFRTITPGPNDYGVPTGRALSIYAPAGQFRLTLDTLLVARDIAPALSNTNYFLAQTHLRRGDDEKALEYQRLAVDLGADAASLDQVVMNAILAQRAGEYSRAAELISGLLPQAALAAGGAESIRQVYAAMEEPSGRQRALSALKRLVGDDGVIEPLPPSYSIQFFAQLGDLDEAFRLAELMLEHYKAERAGVAGFVTLWNPEMREFRRDPRFADYVARIGDMVAYWKKYGPPDECELQGDLLACK